MNWSSKKTLNSALIKELRGKYKEEYKTMKIQNAFLENTFEF